MDSPSGHLCSCFNIGLAISSVQILSTFFTRKLLVLVNFKHRESRALLDRFFISWHLIEFCRFILVNRTVFAENALISLLIVLFKMFRFIKWNRLFVDDAICYQSWTDSYSYSIFQSVSFKWTDIVHANWVCDYFI